MTSRSADARLLLLGGAALAVVAALVALASDGVPVRGAGWLFGGPVATALVAMNRSATIRWSARTGRVPPKWQTVVSVSLVVVGFALSMLHASTVALELS